MGPRAIAARVGVPRERCLLYLRDLPLTREERLRSLRGPRPRLSADSVAALRRLRREEQLTLAAISARTGVSFDTCQHLLRDIPRARDRVPSATIAEIRRLRKEERLGPKAIAARVGLSPGFCGCHLRDLPLSDAERRAIRTTAMIAAIRTPPDIVDTIRRLRRDERLGLDDIVARTGVSKSVCNRYLRDLPLTRAEGDALRAAGRARRKEERQGRRVRQGKR